MEISKHILYLGPDREVIRRCFESTGDRVVQAEGDLRMHPELLGNVDLIVSYGYRHIIRPEVVRRFENRIVNLHISLLPWNRGADPNIWSFLENTPKGVSVHYIDAGVDTGNLLCQQIVPMTVTETLRSSYQKLSDAIESLFVAQWGAIRNGRITGRPQSGSGSFHRMKDLEAYRSLLTDGWDTPVAKLVGMALSRDRGVAHAS